MKNKKQDKGSYFDSKEFKKAMDKAVKVSDEEQKKLVKKVEVLENFEEELRTFGNLCWERKDDYASCQYDRVVETFKEEKEQERKKIIKIIKNWDNTTTNQETAKPVLQYILKEINYEL